MRLRTALKKIERGAKRAVLSGTASLLGAPERSAGLDWSAPRRALFLRHDRIGDMILSTGILDAIAEAQPRLALDVLASPINAPVLDAAPSPCSR